MELAEKLWAIEEITRLKARYFRLLDTKDWPGLAHLFSRDARFDMTASWIVGIDVGDGAKGEPDPGLMILGREAFVELLRRTIGFKHTVHHGHMPEIDVISNTEATGIWAMEDIIRSPEGQAFTSLHAFGHYFERYERLASGWVISDMRLTRLLIRENL